MNLFIGAVAFHLTFTAPYPALVVDSSGTVVDTSRVTRYEARRYNATHPPQEAKLYSDPVALTVLEPKPPGTRVDCYVFVTADPQNPHGWRAGGETIDMRACAGDSCAQWSNQVILATAMPDTNATDGYTWQRTRGGIARFTRTIEQTEMSAFGVPGPLVVQEQVLRAKRADSCRDFGKWALRGEWQTCP